VLQGKVDVLADLVALRHRREGPVVDGRGVQVEHPDPLQTVNLVELAEQAGQRSALPAIDAVERGVLRDQQELLHSTRRQLRGLLHDRAGCPAAIRAAKSRDDAERTLVVAALCDLQVGVVARGGKQPRGVGIVDVTGGEG
jgi:hypothetical protein